MQLNENKSSFKEVQFSEISKLIHYFKNWSSKLKEQKKLCCSRAKLV